jgi:hypothetical protein
LGQTGRTLEPLPSLTRRQNLSSHSWEKSIALPPTVVTNWQGWQRYFRNKTRAQLGKIQDHNAWIQIPDATFYLGTYGSSAPPQFPSLKTERNNTILTEITPPSQIAIMTLKCRLQTTNEANTPFPGTVR